MGSSWCFSAGARALLLLAPCKGQPLHGAPANQGRVGSVTSFTLPGATTIVYTASAGGLRYGFRYYPMLLRPGFIGPHSGVHLGVALVALAMVSMACSGLATKSGRAGQMLNSFTTSPRGHGRCSRTSGSGWRFRWLLAISIEHRWKIGIFEPSLVEIRASLPVCFGCICQPSLMHQRFR